MKKNPITTERSRTMRLINEAKLTGRECCFWLHIADNKDQDSILDDLCEDFMKAYKRITFRTAEIPGGIPCIRSERHGCIRAEDAVIINGELPDVTLLQPPTYLDNNESQLWHFAGGIWLVDNETCFCEYDANKKEGGMMIFIDGKNLPQLLAKYPQLTRKIKFANRKQHNWLAVNW